MCYSTKGVTLLVISEYNPSHTLYNKDDYMISLYEMFQIVNSVFKRIVLHIVMILAERISKNSK
jgi:hypothetical protein